MNKDNKLEERYSLQILINLQEIVKNFKVGLIRTLKEEDQKDAYKEESGFGVYSPVTLEDIAEIEQWLEDKINEQ